MAEKTRITTKKKQATREDKMRRLDRHYIEYTGGEISIENAFLEFTIYREAKR